MVPILETKEISIEHPLQFPCKDNTLKPREFRDGGAWAPEPTDISELEENPENDRGDEQQGTDQDQENLDVPGDRSQEPQQDCWGKRGYYMSRVHAVPRECLFSPLECPDDPPENVPGGLHTYKLDVMRLTLADLDEFHKGYQRIEDVWCGTGADKRKAVRHKDQKKPVLWTGEAWFEPVPPPTPKPTQYWVRNQLCWGRLGSDKPSNVSPFDWKWAGLPARKQMVEQSDIMIPKIREAMKARTIPIIALEGDEVERFNYEYKPMAYPLFDQLQKNPRQTPATRKRKNTKRPNIQNNSEDGPPILVQSSDSEVEYEDPDSASEDEHHIEFENGC